MIVISESTGFNANINVEKKIPLTQENPKKSSSSRRASTLNPTPRRKSMNYDENTNIQSQMRDTRPPATLESKQSDIFESPFWARDTIESQKGDINRISETLRTVQREMSSFQTFMNDVRLEMQQGRKARESYQEDRNVLRKLVQDVNRLEQKVMEKDNPAEGESNTVESLRQDMDVVISDLQRIMDKACEVDDVKEGLYGFVDRFNGFEESTNNALATIPDLSAIGDIKKMLISMQAQVGIIDQGIQTTNNRISSMTDRAQPKAPKRSEVRVPRVEIFIPTIEKSVEHFSTNKERPQTTDAGGDVQTTASKRKRAEADSEIDLVNNSQPELQRKKRRQSGRANLGHQGELDGNQLRYDPTKARAVEVLPPEANKSLSGPDHKKTASTDARTSKKATVQTPAREILPPIKARPNPPLAEPSTRRVSLRKVASTNNLTASTPDVQELSSKERRTTIPGHLLNSNGEIDGRSLRRKTNTNDTSILPLQPTITTPVTITRPLSSSKPTSSKPTSSKPTRTTTTQPIVSKTTSTPRASHDSVLPSIEREHHKADPEPLQRVTRRSEANYLTKTATTPKPSDTGPFKTTSTATRSTGKQTYQCTTCESVFAFPGGLAYVCLARFLPQPYIFPLTRTCLAIFPPPEAFLIPLPIQPICP
jgi:hypothetical protein